jgi:hypothetical protein
VSNWDEKLANVAREFARAWWEDDHGALLEATHDLVSTARDEEIERQAEKDAALGAEGAELLTRIREASARRDEASRYTKEGLAVREAALADLRAYGTEGKLLKLTQGQMYTAAGLGHSQWNDIMNGRVKS